MNDLALKIPDPDLNPEQHSNDMLEDLYPDVYRILYPYVLDMADRLCAGGYVTGHMIESAVEAVHSVSGLGEFPEEEALPTMGHLREDAGGRRRRALFRSTVRIYAILPRVVIKKWTIDLSAADLGWS